MLSDPTASLSRDRRHSLASLFADHKHLRVAIDGVLEGRFGGAEVDDADQPRAAVLRVGVYALLAGDPRAASGLLASVGVGDELVVDNDPAWQQAITHHFDHRTDSSQTVVERSMQTFDASSLSLEHLRGLATVPSEYDLVAVNTDNADRIGPALTPNRIANFDSTEHFTRVGFGYCAIDGGTVACASTTYAVSAGGAEIAIATHPDHRRRGLGVAVAARSVAEAIERGLVPAWHAANDVSSQVAIRLGFRPRGRCRVFEVEESL